MSKDFDFVPFLTESFFCELCDYKTSHKSHFDKHLQSKKHMKFCKKIGKKFNRASRFGAVFKCSGCNKIYTTRQGLHYHKKNKKCLNYSKKLFKNNNKVIKKKDKDDDYEGELSTLMKGMFELCKAQQKTQEKFAENIGKLIIRKYWNNNKKILEY